MIVASIGCPASIGPEVSVAALTKTSGYPRILCGSRLAIEKAAELLGVPRGLFRKYDGDHLNTRTLQILEAGPTLTAADLDPKRPTKRAGASQLAAINTAYQLVLESPRRALVTGPVSKALIASCGVRGAQKFRGHTEWLESLDGAKSSTMCFASSRLVTSLVTTHVPLRLVPRRLTPENVAESTVQLARFLLRSRAVDCAPPVLAICSLNPHAGESELLGKEETTSIVPGIRLARRRLRGRAVLVGPVGAETAYRQAADGKYDGVVAMYHDQATIPLKLLAFGEAVNVTLGLSRVRTSVDHGTAYDIAWQGLANSDGMSAAIELARTLTSAAV